MASIAKDDYTSPIWQAAIDKYYTQLEDGGMRRTPKIDRDLWEAENPSVLINEIQGLVPEETQMSKVWTTVLPTLEPVLASLNDFAAVLAWGLGMNGRVAALLWGSMRLILKFSRPVFPELIVLMAELRTVMPKAQLSEKEFPFSDALADALLNMYTEIIVFYAYAITFFRNNPNIKTSRHAWSEFNSRFRKVITNLRGYSRKVDEIADMIRLSKETYSAETVKAITSLQNVSLRDRGIPCHMIPYGLNLKFLSRSEEVDTMEKILDSDIQTNKLKVLAICGLGGVGKTQLALHYANSSLKRFDAIAWIQADTQIKLVQSLAAFASKLGLPKKEGAEDDYQSVQKVKDWLNSSGRSFLLIFDNLEDAKLLGQIWPSSYKGSVIITSRSPSVASRRATKTIFLKSFATDIAVNVLYTLTGMDPTSDADADAASEVCSLIGGLPLAISHMSSFIQDRGYSYEEFLALYKKHAQRIFVKPQSHVDYDHTLNTVWELSVEVLSPNSRALLNLLSLFDPDSIIEKLLTGSNADISDKRFEFLTDDFDFGDAVSQLMTQASLINRITSSKSLSLHRMVKFATFIRIPEEDRGLYLDTTIQMLYHSFPNTWDERGDHQGHGWKSWQTCSAIVAHLSSLMSLHRQYDIRVSNVEMFAELIFRIGTYLWESEQPMSAKTFFEYGLGLDIDPSSPLSAQAARLLGHIGLDVAQPRAGLNSYLRALQARKTFEPLNSSGISEVLDSVACAYAEIGDVPRALENLAEADKMNHARNNRTSARTQAVYSMAYLRGNEPEKALEALLLCWKLQGKTQEDISNSEYPKHAGDIILLARINYAQGEKEEAQRLASRSITMRRGMYGAKGPRVADSIFVVANMLAAENENVLAAKMFGEVVEMSRGMREMKGHIARGLWYLASIEEKLGNASGAEELRREAKQERSGIPDRESPDEDTDEAFSSLVGWMLW